MDLSFSGLSTAATEAAKKYDLEDVCYSLQETAFAMLVEVTERAMAHAEKKEAMLVGGVGANKRLGEMLNIMCEERGARFFLPPRKYMGDNGSMIAYTGMIMLKSGMVTSLADSKVRPGYRTDDVEVKWA
jgi:tRNA A37 threonylcarbamoyltransferase TsaD